MLVSRSTEESHLYMHLHPCECGEADFEWREHGLVQSDERLISVYSGECERCDRPRVFEFALVPEPAPPPPALGGPNPSSIIDPGEFLQTSQVFAGTVPADLAALSDDEFYGAYDALAFALANVDEVLKFIPAGADAVPPETFRNPAGQELHARSPELFSRSRLLATRDEYGRLLAEYDAAARASASSWRREAGASQGSWS
ncbi:MAG: hypothetical protein GEV12_14535 [Micromonosporaceae bacterium]|nr:hypothetical protein [Micromonosporaceae bacterium]